MNKIQELDYSQFSKKELDELYHKIIDSARKNPEYRRYVMDQWNIGIEDFWKRVYDSQMIEIKKEIEKKNLRHAILKYFVDRWKTMTDEEADREWQYLRAEVAYKIPN